MAQQLALAPTVSAADSTDIVISGQATVFLYAAAGAMITCGVQITFHRKIGADYEVQPFVQLDRENRATDLSSGTYRAKKGATPQAIGVGADS